MKIASVYRMLKKFIACHCSFLIVVAACGFSKCYSAEGIQRFANSSYDASCDSTFAGEMENIVFLGDSITYRCNWKDYFPEKHVLNCGKCGDTSEGVLNRLDEVLSSRLSKVFIMIGINDVSYGVAHRDTVKNIERICAKISEHSPECKIYLQSILPCRKFGLTKIIPVNEGMKEIASRKRNTLYVDVEKAFLTQDYRMRAE